LVRDAASVSSLIMATGLRPGSTRDTKAETQAFGATTLEGRHVVVSGTNVRLKFTGKKGVPIDIPVNNPMVAALLRERKESAGDSGRLFNVSDSQLRGYAKTLDGGSFKPKDFRTHKGTSLAANLVSRGSVPKSEKEYKSRVREVAKSVAAALGNTPAVALQSYIDPTVFSKWRPAA
jgi:DNA topoisomerase-1